MKPNSDQLIIDRHHQLKQDEWEQLHNRFHLIDAKQRDMTYSITAKEMLNKDKCAEILDLLTVIIQSPSPKVTASLLSKRIAFLTTASCLYALSVFNKGLNLSMDNCYLEFGHTNQLWQSAMPLLDLSSSMPSHGQRDQWRHQLISNLFANHLAKLWATLSEVAEIPLPILWENTAVRVYSLYERQMEGIRCPQLKQRISEDFHYLITANGTEVFGVTRNPIARFLGKKQPFKNKNNITRFRRTCCFYYKASTPRTYCSNCPLTKPKNTNA